MQQEFSIESQEDAEKAIVQRLREIYSRYETLGVFFQELSEKEERSSAGWQPSSSGIEEPLATAKCGKT